MAKEQAQANRLSQLANIPNDGKELVKFVREIDSNTYQGILDLEAQYKAVMQRIEQGNDPLTPKLKSDYKEAKDFVTNIGQWRSDGRLEKILQSEIAQEQKRAEQARLEAERIAQEAEIARLEAEAQRKQSIINDRINHLQSIVVQATQALIDTLPRDPERLQAIKALHETLLQGIEDKVRSNPDMTEAEFALEVSKYTDSKEHLASVPVVERLAQEQARQAELARIKARAEAQERAERDRLAHTQAINAQLADMTQFKPVLVKPDQRAKLEAMPDSQLVTLKLDFEQKINSYIDKVTHSKALLTDKVNRPEIVGDSTL